MFGGIISHDILIIKCSVVYEKVRGSEIANKEQQQKQVQVPMNTF